MFFDELDIFLDGFRKKYILVSEEEKPKVEEEDIIDELLDLYLLAYYEGSKDAGRELMMDIEPDVEKAREIINRPIAGETFEDRVRKYAQGDMGETTGTPAEAIARVAETDSVRIYNEAKLDTALDYGATEKIWHTMGDEKVRDTHQPLDGVSAPIDGLFYTYDGDRAAAPGLFSDPSNNVNCRCWLTVN